MGGHSWQGGEGVGNHTAQGQPDAQWAAPHGLCLGGQPFTCTHTHPRRLCCRCGTALLASGLLCFCTWAVPALARSCSPLQLLLLVS